MPRPKKSQSKPRPESNRRVKFFQAPKGTYDILPEKQVFWERIYRVVKEIAEAYGFFRIDTPILEEAELYIKGIGQGTDIVEKEMYTLRTRGGDFLALRPEFTAGVIRAYLENGLVNLPQPVKFYSLGPIFRYERPQASRFRQHQQINFEVIGSEQPVIDAQIIQLFFVIFGQLNLKGINLQINSIGCLNCRPDYKKLLISYYKNKSKKLCPDCKRRLKQNPLRLLDCKDQKCLQIIFSAPQIIDHLCSECHNHFKSVLEFLDEIEIPYILNPYLVRGLDYYTKTVFEFWPEEGGGRQVALGGGGRYDYLVKILGGKETSATGGAAGIERIIAQMESQRTKIFYPLPAKVFLVQLGDLAKRRSLKLFEQLRQAGITLSESFSKDNIKSQLKLADKLGVKITLILGQREALDETVIIRDMSTGVQEIVPMDKIIKELKKRLIKK